MFDIKSKPSKKQKIIRNEKKSTEIETPRNEI